MKQNLPASSEVKEFAAIDLGSNSFHMIVIRIVNGSVRILSRLKQRVQLAQGLDRNNRLSAEAIKRGTDCLALFAERLQGFSPDNVQAVATYTLRQAVNSEEFLTAAAQIFPFPIRIISGVEEAKLIYSGVAHTQPDCGRKLVIDIGGGSTEMIIGDEFTPLAAESRPMGCVSFSKRFFAEGKISEKAFMQAYKTALSTIEDLSWEYRNLGWQTVIGASGTIKTVSQIIQENIDKSGLISAENLQLLIKRVLKFDHIDKLKMPGLSEERAPIFVPGLAILHALFENFRIKQMYYSEGALREGVIYSFEESFNQSDVHQRTINSLLKQFSVDRKQADRVAQSAALLGAKYQHWKNPEQAEEMRLMLHAGAMLHEIGIAVNHNGMHKHSAYLIKNSDLPGFDQAQQNLLTHLLRYHTKALKLNELTEENRYAAQDTKALIILLRLAVILNHSRSATESTEKFTLDTDENAAQWELEFEQGYLERNPLTAQELAKEKEILAKNHIRLVFK
ncbi:exopolyphosphatase/guanosine-5'-triphosphate,3'-diphosphate pyrophosphatase [Mesocricetibacter intestinalis]|uniref:Exopolyphosphatase n=1 Tax=Mesocricetibacter intestinalis TaxID=1521930 RepID=A0A4R6V763_9PAST|nr:exopolyphosphatase [Mesocricetibacter intestinalis]TDQ56833.1 exopolyphosphatase/guanosine-5'-triphosphate,3'-diphosphate pyrophosphatase [Mesocricetibacter intestinalis]